MSNNTNEGLGGCFESLTDPCTDQASEDWNDESELGITKKNSRSSKRNHWLPEVSSFIQL